MIQEKKKTAVQRGINVLIGLGVLTAVEYGVSLIEFSTIALFVISIFKAGLIMNYFMHIGSLWSEEGKH